MSTLAVVVVVLCIPLSIGTFFAMRPLPAALVVVLGAEMFLPVGAAFKIPFVHELGKNNLFYLCTFVACMLRCPSRVTELTKDKWIVLIAFIAAVGGTLTGLTNGDAIILGGEVGTVLPALNLKDGFSLVLSEFFPSLLAFYLGYALVRDARDVERVLVALAVAGLIYCPFAIVEMRMSPQFHQWIYGYNTGQFDQGIRWGGYRPKVFMTHGLALARFFTVSTLALFVLGKARRILFGLPVRLLAWFQLVVLVLCRSTGAIIEALIGVLLVSLVRPKRQLLVASILAFATVIYPLLRATDLFPVAGVLDAAGLLGEDRRQSLEFRFTNEDRLLAHARERPWFGWGNGRNRIYDEDGKDVSVTDGYWIVVFGVNGLAGFVVGFGALLWPVFSARHRLAKHGNERQKTQMAGLAVIAALIGVDLIPNGVYAVWPFLLSGVLARGLRELEPTVD
ncbi:MAG: O-antigen ligase family protein [Polyangia bacterium]